MSQASEAPRIGTRGTTTNMLARMGGRMISFYADELTELLLDEYLIDTASELQKIEKLS